MHGSRNVDQRVTVNGINTMTLQAGGNIGGQTPDVGSAAEVTVDTTSLGADLPTGGVRINFIPKDGGNTFANSTFFTLRERAASQGNNFTDELKAAGSATPNEIMHELRPQRVVRRADQARQGLVLVLDALQRRGERGAGLRERERVQARTSGCTCPTRPARRSTRATQINNSLRVTWQATPRNKIAGTYKADTWCNCPNDISATRGARGRRDRRFPRLRQEHAEWTSPVTNKLLARGRRHAPLRAVGRHAPARVNGGSSPTRRIEAILPAADLGDRAGNGPRSTARATNNNNTLGAELHLPRGVRPT